MVFKDGFIPYNKASLIGDRFGRLRVLDNLPSINNRAIWLCKCECGNFVRVSTTSLKSGNTKSCGCLHKDIVRDIGKLNAGRKGLVGDKNAMWKGGLKRSGLAWYETYADRLIGVDIIRKNTNGLLETRCAYCGRWFLPKNSTVKSRVNALDTSDGRESRFYCSGSCKLACPVFHKQKYPKGFKPATSREVQPELRQLVLERDDYTCQKCGKTVEEAQLHCHHIDPVSQNPIESADIDNCITLCKECHKEVHKKDDCKYHELRC